MKQLLIVMFCLIALPAVAQAPAPEPLKAGYKAFCDAANHHDAAGALKVLTSDYTWTNQEGMTLNRQSFDQTFTESLPRVVRLEVVIEGVTVTNNAAVAVVMWREAYKDGDATRVYLERDREVWVVADGNWRISRSDVLSTGRVEDTLTPR